MRPLIRMTAIVSFAVAIAFSSSAATHNIPKTSLNLGDTNADLVYTPLAPCRIIDTRVGGGSIAAGVTRSYFVSGTIGFDTQGGTAGGCGVPTTATAVLINFVAVNPQGVGNLKGSAYPNAIPATGSIINYQALNPVLNVANGIAFPICNHATTTCAFDISLFANNSGTDVVADVLGYFKRFAKEQIVSSVTVGAGLTGGGVGDVTLGVDTTQIQARVTGVPCTAGSAVSSIAADGSVTCTAFLPQTRTFAPGTYTVVVPPAAVSMVADFWGGGGAGGAGSGSNGGGGGGGGAYTHAIIAVSPGSSITLNVGAAGVGAAGSSGTAGGDTGITGVLIAHGGGGGTAGTPIGGPGTGGAAGTVTFGTGVTPMMSGNGANGGGGSGGFGGSGGASGFDSFYTHASTGSQSTGGNGCTPLLGCSAGDNGQPGLAVITFSQ